MDRRTACLNQANAFREKAIADPEHHDQWIDEAIKWLERAMEEGYHVAVTVEAGDGRTIPKPTAAADTILSHRHDVQVLIAPARENQSRQPVAAAAFILGT
ncbi:hypothetical protein [Bradyrhizobium sp. UFLA05-112]